MSGTAPDRFAAARSVADAVLYEGYILYPYRASSRKNQVRFQWGVLTPKDFSEAEGSERWSQRTECLLDPGAAPVLAVRVRCLQTQRRRVEAARVPGRGGPPFEPVDHLDVDGTRHVGWDEAVERVVDVPPLALVPPWEATHTTRLTFDGDTAHELVATASGEVAGRFSRSRFPVEGVIMVTTERPDPGASFVKVTVTVKNTTPWHGTSLRRDDAMDQSLVAVHIMLAVDDATFVSLLDPPDGAITAARACRSDGAYPVLIGDDDVVLASPIILYDHPEVAPQSPGDLYDSTRDRRDPGPPGDDPDRRREGRGPGHRPARGGDHRPLRRHVGRDPERAARPDEGRSVNGHPGPRRRTRGPRGGILPPTPRSTRGRTRCGSSGVEVKKGTAVRLRPSQRSDAQDMFLDGLDGDGGRGLHRRRRRHARRGERSTTTRPARSWSGRAATCSSTRTRSSPS